MKYNNKGFVLIETLIVTLLLTVTLMSLYSSFSYMVTKSRDKSNHDSMETLYKTYFIKDLINSAYATAKGESGPANPFIYYVNNLAGEEICDSFTYDGFPSNPDVNKIIRCNVGIYATDNSYRLYNGRDPIYEASLAYNIDYIYFVKYSGLYDDNGNLKSDVVNKIFDASTIDYIRSQKSTDSNNMLLIKYDEDYYYPAGYDAGDLKINKDIFHSSISVLDVNRNTALPLTLMDAEKDLAVEWGEYSVGKTVELPADTFGTNAERSGYVLVGWTTTSKNVDLGSIIETKDKDGNIIYKVDDNADFSKCVVNTNAGNSTDIDGEAAYCYKVSTTITVADYNRDLYAVWCDSKQTIDGLVQCQRYSSTHTSYTKGVNPYLNYTCGARNNYIVFAPDHKALAGQTCFVILGNLGTHSFDDKDGYYHNLNYRVMYAGIYGINGCYFPRGNSYGGNTVNYTKAEELAGTFYSTYIAKYTDGYNLFVKDSKGLLDYVDYTKHLSSTSKSNSTYCIPSYMLRGTSFWLRKHTDGKYYYVDGKNGTVHNTNNSWDSLAFYPVVTVKGTTKLWGGAGTKEQPYIIAVS